MMLAAVSRTVIWTEASLVASKLSSSPNTESVTVAEPLTTTLVS